MKEDRAITAIGVLTGVLALLMLSTGRWIMGGIVALLAFGIFWNRGGGKLNDRSIFENIVKTDLTIDEIYDKFKDMETPLGRAWIAEHKGYEGKSIVFGPSKYKDIVVISRNKNYVDIKHITLTDNIIRGSEDEYRFENLLDSSNTSVTPRTYSVFASLKLASVMMIKHMTAMIEKMATGEDVKAPNVLDIYNFYYHNSSEGWFRDADENGILRVENSMKPFRAILMNADDEEMASVSARKINSRGFADDSAGFDIMASGEHYGEIRPFKDKTGEGYAAETEDGTFKMVLFPACRRANISCNYMIEKDGELKAVIGGSPKLIFEDIGRFQNDVILSYDDDYLVLYAALEIFVMTYNSSFLK